MASEVITRFAPSPTGHLHLGHAFAAREAFEFARENAGICLLRIEDIDQTRCRPEYSDEIEDVLSWLGFEWPKPVRVQSQHMDEYADILNALTEMGLTYRCFKSRKELPDGLYRGSTDPHEDEKLASGEPYSWRLSIPACKKKLGIDALGYEETGTCNSLITFQLSALTDEIIARKDIGTSYLIACTYDDHLQGITHIVRGEDIAAFTPHQVLIQKLMGWDTPIYHHHGLVKNAQGAKLSKRNQDTAISAMRAQGVTPKMLLGKAAL